MPLHEWNSITGLSPCWTKMEAHGGTEAVLSVNTVVIVTLSSYSLTVYRQYVVKVERMAVIFGPSNRYIESGNMLLASSQSEVDILHIVDSSSQVNSWT